ncbi:MAG: hypothetical protein IJV31_07355 [Clostridia bacterium]|nr:hypothetical protein [Clostridia bacterium]
MPKSPYVRTPFSYYGNYPPYTPIPNIPPNFIPPNGMPFGHSPRNNMRPASMPQSDMPSSNIPKPSTPTNVEADYMFDLFGLKLYYDDILIVSLLFFLYKQGVKDEGLFIALILLLLS